MLLCTISNLIHKEESIGDLGLKMAIIEEIDNHPSIEDSLEGSESGRSLRS